MAQKINTITDLIGNLVSSRFALNQSYSIQNPYLSMVVSKLKGVDLPREVDIENAKILLPTFCDIMTDSEATTTTTTASPYLDLSTDNNCTNRVITLKARNQNL